MKFHKKSVLEREMKRTVIRVLQITLEQFIFNRDGLWVIIKLVAYQIFDSRFSRDMPARQSCDTTLCAPHVVRAVSEQSGYLDFDCKSSKILDFSLSSLTCEAKFVDLELELEADKICVE